MKSSTTPAGITPEELEEKVKGLYREVALNPGRFYHFETGRRLAERLGYPAGVLDQLPAPAIDSFAGVGYYFHLAELRSGQRVADLGSGAGMDAFITALYTGRSGEVVGIDMTGEQVAKARRLSDQYGFRQVRFIEGNLMNLPLANATMDAVISNGVINLVANKEAAFREAARVLRPGGRMVLADIVATRELPFKMSCNASLWAARSGGAMAIDQYTSLIESSGFKVVMIEDNSRYAFISENARGVARKFGVKSISLLAIKK